MAPLSMFSEKNTGCNLPAQVDVSAVSGSSYELLFIAKGGGSANKTFLFQQTKVRVKSGSAAGFQAPVSRRAERLALRRFRENAESPDGVLPVRVPRRKDPRHRHVGLPALPLGSRHWRTQRRADA